MEIFAVPPEEDPPMTAIEETFYDELRKTRAIFSVKPCIQASATRWEPDFLVIYEGRAHVVELDGHGTHSSKQQRTNDVIRERWFETRGIPVHRWTGTEVYGNPTRCVGQLLDILRRSGWRF